ncbi:hypothetical protein MNBD_BACTEROID01-2020 [hydrothermal vent metagenome]|uniref:Uncharacterized protein n=1 Tax=hydrothermal vent metagenome TaxID=652676 RepID=A0A3B0T2U4_9ZZZZ
MGYHSNQYIQIIGGGIQQVGFFPFYRYFISLGLKEIFSSRKKNQHRHKVMLVFFAVL